MAKRLQELYTRYIVERTHVNEIECGQTVEKSRVVQCQWKWRHNAPINMTQQLSVFDFTGHRKEFRTVTGFSITLPGWRLKYNVEYEFQIGPASTKSILRGKLIKRNIHNLNGFT